MLSTALATLAVAGAIALTIGAAPPAAAEDYTVIDEPSLSAAITAANASPDAESTITFGLPIFGVSAAPYAISKTLTIDTGAGFLTGFPAPSSFGPFGVDGESASFSGGNLTLRGEFTGGTGGDAVGLFGALAGAGGAGVTRTDGSLTIDGATLTGGRGGGFTAATSFVFTGGVGGAGVEMTNGDIVNRGTVLGGTGGSALGGIVGGGANIVGGAGGAGVVLTNGSLNNSGHITGGNGDDLGAGGVGVIGVGATIINSGTIAAGFASDGTTRANAIEFSGGTNVLELQSGFTITGNVVGTGTDTFRLGGATSSTFDISNIGGQYQGFGSFEKTGTSNWTLTGTSTFTGPTNIDGGTLSVNGSIASSILTRVNAGGVLGGNGTVGNTTIVSGGTLAPGNSIGTITVNGNLALSSAAIYLVQVSPSEADRTNVTGIANLGGTVQAVFAPGSYVTKSYTILHADGGHGGAFASLSTTDLPAGFAADLSYTADDVYLNLTATLGDLPGADLNINQQNVATALNGFFNSGGVLPPNFVTVFGLTGTNLTNALSQLSGEVATGTEGAVFRLGDQFLSVMLDPFVGVQFGHFDRFSAGGGRMSIAADRRAEMQGEIEQAHGEIFRAPGSPAVSPADRPWTVWGMAYGGGNRTVGDVAGSGTHDVTAAAGGIATGVDYRVTADTVAGFAIGMGTTGWNVSDGLGNGSSKAVNVGLYGATHFGPAYLAMAFAFSNHWVTTDRYAFMGDHLSADFNVINFGGRVEGGYRFDATPRIGVIPYAAVQVQALRMPGFTENDTSGVGFGLSYAAADATDTRGELGARFQDLTEIGGAPVMLRARLAWAHDWANNPALTATFQALPGSSFVVNGAAQPSDSALTSVGAEVWLNPSTSILAKFDGELAGVAQAYGGSARLRYTF